MESIYHIHVDYIMMLMPEDMLRFQKTRTVGCFYISLSNNVGGAVLIDHKVYKGKAKWRNWTHDLGSGRKDMLLWEKGCMEAYCNARILSENTGGNLEKFFQQLAVGNENMKKSGKNI